jgi:oligopeptide/dipeptide ABC transporter ATP-binding protein
MVEATPANVGDASSLLVVRGLCVRFEDARKRAVRVVDEVSLEIAAGEALGVLGESGSGKTSTLLAVLGLLPGRASVGGSVRFRGEELLGAGEARLRKFRGAQVGFVFQEPASALNPVMRAGDQVAEVVRAHGEAREARARARAALEAVGLPEPALHDAYPHELSGGQRQRVAIAQAIACRPALLIADEPTTALDALSRSEVLTLFARLRTELGLALIVVSHDVRALAFLVDRVIVFYAGRAVESGPRGPVLETPLHPYTRGLLECVPRPPDASSKALRPIPGSAPDPALLPPGCAFGPRCPDRQAHCVERVPELTSPAPARSVRCVVHG